MHENVYCPAYPEPKGVIPGFGVPVMELTVSTFPELSSKAVTNAVAPFDSMNSEVYLPELRNPVTDPLFATETPVANILSFSAKSLI